MLLETIEAARRTLAKEEENKKAFRASKGLFEVLDIPAMVAQIQEEKGKEIRLRLPDEEGKNPQTGRTVTYTTALETNWGIHEEVGRPGEGCRIMDVFTREVVKITTDSRRGTVTIQGQQTNELLRDKWVDQAILKSAILLALDDPIQVSIRRIPSYD